jgi:hypothetical protein
MPKPAPTMMMVSPNFTLLEGTKPVTTTCPSEAGVASDAGGESKDEPPEAVATSLIIHPQRMSTRPPAAGATPNVD